MKGIGTSWTMNKTLAERIALLHVDGPFISRSAWAARGYLDSLARCAVAL